MQSFLSDLRLSVRRLLARPIGTLVAIITLSLGIGAVSTMYLLFKAGTDDLPRVPDVERVGRVLIVDRAARETRIPPATAEWQAWLDSPPTGVRLAVVDDIDVTVDPGAHGVRAQRVSPAFFAVAGVRPEIGRVFETNERGAIVSRRLWDLLSPGVRKLGATVSVDGDARAIVGVMPASFWMPARGTDVWLPSDNPAERPSAYVLARLEDGTSAEQASAALTPVVQHLRGKNHAARVRLLAGDAAVRFRTGVLMLIGPALLVLLAVCANVAALLLGDVHRRQRELAIRAALGANRWRLAREVFADALAIAVVGGIVSLAGAFWSIRALRAAFASVSPDFAQMMPSFAAVAPIALGAALLAVLGVGYVPALFASRVRIVADLTGRGNLPLFKRGRYGSADLLLVLQIGMAAALVLWTAIFASVFDQVRTIAPHVPADRVWGIEVTARRGAPVLPPQLPGVFLAHAAAIPGIEAAGVAEDAGARRTWTTRSQGGAVTMCSAWLERVAGDYFEAQNFPTRGRRPMAGDVVLNETAARRCGQPNAVRESSPGAPVLRVVGSVDDQWFGAGIPGGPRGPATLYTTLTSPTGRSLVLKVRSAAVSTTAARSLREDLAKSFPGVTFGEPLSLAAETEQHFSAGVLIGKLLEVLAILALFFGIVGLHAAITQALTARTREVGVRIALGAAPRNVVGVTVGRHAVPALIGILLGAGVAVGGLAMLSTDDATMIRELALLTARSPAAWAALLGLLLASSLLSAALPVVRALRLDPAVVLRQE